MALTSSPPTQDASEAKAPGKSLIQLSTWVYDRGHRPLTRGWFHHIATWLAVIAGTALTTFSYLKLPWLQATGVLIYALALVGLFGVSTAYHRGKWKSLRTINWWRRADHSMIALFIAATYTPLCLISLPDQWWMLAIAWVGAGFAVVLNMCWINHPRWLDVVVYLALGWLIIPLLPQLRVAASPAILWLLFAGGVVYSFGALLYGCRWPGRKATVLGYHEVFHLTTIIAASVHFIAVWMLVA
ncbi:predicted membrane proteins [Corynebacterium kutscheri]|uniref:Channel protein, hemolysin III family n=1 Tax=Corynebacterium kutscheri TaxID=35755 RepID=A0A0F6QYU3_9CORY|nr:hemolysin III family protein [Corynebacterium kutscheri]AKE40787.1 channel protein, hemolysin III family [Corynebacterium kutscheri]VEH04500.1 predicted membrane proteins [Corynebacterium kutscheri]VEH11185.1 predicted membrane proteins [Corynebacterium kutscheri]VEH80337.1 predicted membrane proteins [Corynebacterium kutscheri]